MKVCEITGKVAQVGNNVSHSNIKTKRRFNPNLRIKRFWSEEEGRWITLKVTAAGMKNYQQEGTLRRTSRGRGSQKGLLIEQRR
ncbi:MAG: 50S ribosomal protein L28 [Alistipes putredinis]|nr:MAG: 50S ribosomal protein L28 [Alistipes putredinis]